MSIIPQKRTREAQKRTREAQKRTRRQQKRTREATNNIAYRIAKGIIVRKSIAGDFLESKYAFDEACGAAAIDEIAIFPNGVELLLVSSEPLV